MSVSVSAAIQRGMAAMPAGPGRNRAAAVHPGAFGPWTTYASTLRQGGQPMIDFNRRTILTTGAAAAAASTAPQVFAQAPQAGAPPRLEPQRLAGRRQGRILREGQCPHPLRRDRLWLPAAGDARRRPELAHRRMVACGDQHHGGVQERLPRDHHGPAQRHRRRVHRPGTGRRSLERVRRRPARRDGPSRHPTSSSSSATASAARSR